MRVRHVIGMLFLLTAALIGPGCALDTGETKPPPTPAEEPPGKDQAPFDASLFHFSAIVPDDGHDASGGAQIAAAVLNFSDGRDRIIPHTWSCLIRVWLPLRLNYITISPSMAADMAATVADDASSTVMHSQEDWPATGQFCKALAAKMVDIWKKTPGGPTGARVTSP